MDAKERHELKDNDLAEFLENFGAFWDKHGNKISVFILIVVVGWFGLKYYSGTQANRHENAWADLASTTIPQGYRERAKENAGIPGLSNLALLRGAEAYHQQAVKLGNEEVDPESGLMSAAESLDNAEAMYKQVLDSNIDPVYRANAAVGLANVEETRHDFKAANGYWTQAEQIAQEARLSAIAVQARIRLTLLDDLAKPIIFADPKPVSAPIEDTPSETDTAVEPDAQAPAVEVPATPAVEETAAPAVEVPATPAAEDTAAPADPG